MKIFECSFCFRKCQTVKSTKSGNISKLMSAVVTEQPRNAEYTGAYFLLLEKNLLVN